MKKLLTILLSTVMIVASFTMNVFADEHNHTGWTNWGDEESEWTSLPSEVGNYYLTHDVILSNTWNVKADGITNLCLNGHVIKANATDQNKFSVVNIPSNAGLNLYDCNPNATHTGDFASLPNGGVITGGKGTKNQTTDLWSGGGVHINVNTVKNTFFNMYGGTICNNASENGGGVYINANNGAASFNMYGGTICNNTSEKNGGGVYVADKASFVMNGGSITNNAALREGGGIWNYGSTTTIINGKISENEAYKTDSYVGIGGGIYSSGDFTVIGGEFSDNKAGVAGGAIFTYGGMKLGGSPTFSNNITDDGENEQYSDIIVQYEGGQNGVNVSIGDGTSTQTYKDIDGNTQNVPTLITNNIGINAIKKDQWEDYKLLDDIAFFTISNVECANHFVSNNDKYSVLEKEEKTYFALKPQFNLCNGTILYDNKIPTTFEPFCDFELVGFYSERTGGKKITSVTSDDYGKTFYAHWKDRSSGRLVLCEQLSLDNDNLYIGLSYDETDINDSNRITGGYKKNIANLGELDGGHGSDFALTYGIKYDVTSKTLTLDKANIMPIFPYFGSKPAAILTNQDSTIKLVGTNRLGNPVLVDLNDENLNIMQIYSSYGTVYGIGASGSSINFIGDDNCELVIHDQQVGIKAKDVIFNKNFKGKIEIKDLGLGFACAIDSSNTVKLLGGKFDLTSYASNGISANETQVGGNAKVDIFAFSGRGITNSDNIVFNGNADVNISSYNGFYITNGASLTVNDAANVKIESQDAAIQADDNATVNLLSGTISLKVPENNAISTEVGKQVYGNHRIISNGKFQTVSSNDVITPLNFSKPVVISFGINNGQITTGATNSNTNIKDVELKAITKSQAQTIVDTDSTLVSLKQALNDGKNIIIYTEIEEPSDGSKLAFISMNIDETNAVILDINLYGEIVGEPDSKKQITDTNGYKTTVSITLTPEQASKINIANNKNYFILREHNGAIEKIPATLTTDVNGNYVFTFETDKFSAYAISSENKPTSNPGYNPPKTGIK